MLSWLMVSPSTTMWMLQ